MKSLKKVKESDIYKTLIKIGLEDVSSERQIENKTIALYDSVSDATYTFTASGYFCRSIEKWVLTENGFAFKKCNYQLNPRYEWCFSRATRTYPGAYKNMMTMAVPSILSYRKTVEKERIKKSIDRVVSQLKATLI